MLAHHADRRFCSVVGQTGGEVTLDTEACYWRAVDNMVLEGMNSSG